MVGPRRTCTDRRRRHPQAAGPQDPRAGRVDGRARPVAGDADPRARRRRRGDAQVDLAGDLPRAARAGARSTARRSSSSTAAAAPSASRCGSTSWPSEEIARAHHGSLAREERTVVEEMLKAGELPCLVATSSLELGIDMGAVDLVLQVESPKSVARGLQRIGRAGHRVGDTSKGRIFPKFRADLLECAVVVKLMREGRIEPTVVPRNALDVLAQQIVAIAAVGRSDEPVVGRRAVRARHAHALLRRAVARRCSRTSSTCSTAATRRASSASCARASSGTASAGRSARARARASSRSPTPARSPTAACSPSCCPTAAASASSTRRWSTRRAPGQTFLLGASTWRIEEIGRDRVIVTPAPGVPGAVPFWKGDSVGRPKELGEAIGAFSRWAVDQPAEVLERDYDLDALAAQQPRSTSCASSRTRRASCRATARSSSSASATRSATGGCASSRPTAGASTPPGASRCRARIRERVRPRVRRDLVRRRDHRPPPRRRRAAGRRPRARRARRARGRRRRRARPQRAVRRALPRERRPRAADPARLPRQAHAAVAAAAEVAVAARGRQALRASSRSSSRPTASACATCSTCPGLTELLRELHRRELVARRGRDADRVAVRLVAAVRLRRDVHVRGRHAQRRAPRGGAVARPRPAARAARPGGAARADRPRRAASRSRPTSSTAPTARAPTTRDALADVLRRLGDLTDRRGRRPRARRPRRRGDARPSSRRERRAVRAARRRRGALDRRRRRRPVPRRARRRRRPAGCPRRSWPTSPDALDEARRAATRARTARSPPASCATRYGVDPTSALTRARARRRARPRRAAPRRQRARVVRPRGPAPPAPRVAGRRCARRSRPPTSARWRAFLPSWQGVDRHPAAGAGIDRLREVLVPLQGLALPADVWERDVLPRRCGAYSPTWLDQLCASGEVVWVGAGALGPQLGPRRALLPRGRRGDRRRRRNKSRARRPTPEHDAAPRAPRRGAVLLHRPAGRARRSRPRRSRRRCGTSSGPAR